MSNNARAIGNYEFSQYAFLNSDGYPMGVDTSPDAVTNGADTGAYVYTRNISLGGFSKSYETFQAKGGGTIWAKHVIGVSDVSNMPLSLSGEDAVLQSYWNGSTVDTTTNSNNTGFSPNHGNSDFPNFISVHCSRYHDANGNTKWRNHFILNHTVIQPSSPQQSDSGGTNPNPLSFELVPTRSNRLPWGQLFADNANITVQDDRAYEYILESEYPYGIHTYIDDNSGTTDAFTLQYVPAVTTAGYFYIYNNGSEDGSNHAVAADGDVTISTPNAAGSITVVIYPMAYPLVATS